MSKHEIRKRSISSFFEVGGEYFNYALYTVENRALPSIIDGLKPGARKVLHAGLKTLKGETKFLNLVGSTLQHSAYHHGDASLVGTILTLSQEYTDNLAPLEIVGSAGSLRARETAAPRYLGIQLSKYAKLYRQDESILPYKMEDGESIEPEYYLPLIPLVLTKRTGGMGIGYKYDQSISYNPLELIDSCLNVLETGKASLIRPYIKQFAGVYEQNEDRTWAEARWTHQKDKIIVTELPPSETFESYEDALDSAKAKGLILDWENDSVDDNLKYIIKGNAADLTRMIEKKQHWKALRLGEYLKRPTLTLLDENGRVAIFNTIEEIIEYFTNFRLGLYTKLKSVKIEDLETRISKLSEILLFLELYLDGKIKLDRNTPIDKTKEQLDSYKLPHSVLAIQFNKLSKEEYDKLANQKAELEAELQKVKTTPEKTMYTNDLKALRKDLEGDFPVINEFKIAE